MCVTVFAFFTYLLTWTRKAGQAGRVAGAATAPGPALSSWRIRARASDSPGSRPHAAPVTAPLSSSPTAKARKERTIPSCPCRAAHATAGAAAAFTFVTPSKRRPGVTSCNPNGKY